MTRQQFEEHVDILKGFSTEKFNSIIEYNESEIENWLVEYVIKNQDVEESIHNISHDLRELEGELFDIKIKHEINVAPMKEYIEEWFKKALINITKKIKKRQLVPFQKLSTRRIKGQQRHQNEREIRTEIWYLPFSR
jgi:hypothetical protein